MIFIKKTFTKIVEYFKYHYGPLPDKNKKDDEIKENSISFRIDEWNRFYIKIKLDLDNNASCEEFGKMLFFLQDGRYEQNIVDAFVDMATKRLIKTDNVQKVMSGWTALLAQNLNHQTSPCIKPTEVFK
jgi:hypothetical protein